MFRTIVPAFRFFLVWLSIALPLSLPAYFLFSIDGLIGSFSLTLLFLVIVGLFAEFLIIRVHQGRVQTPVGLRKTLHRVLEQNSQDRAPRLMIYPDPSPNAICLRGFWSRGTIMVSQGMTALLSEQELRAVLKECLDRCRDSNLLVATLCGVLASFAVGSAPRPWVNTALLGGVLAGIAPSRLKSSRKAKKRGRSQSAGMTPLAAMRFLIFYPFVRMLLYLGRRVETHSTQGQSDLARVNATHKLKGVWDYIAKPEYLHLYLLHGSR